VSLRLLGGHQEDKGGIPFKFLQKSDDVPARSAVRSNARRLIIDDLNLLQGGLLTIILPCAFNYIRVRVEIG
jgi:hypothetical protein